MSDIGTLGSTRANKYRGHESRRVAHRRPVLRYRRERPNRPTVDNACRRSWRPRFGGRFNVHIARGDIVLNGQALAAGDAAKLTDIDQISIGTSTHAEVLLFDLP